MSRFRFSRLAAGLAVMTLIFSGIAVDHAEARRGGSFGSRGMRTYQSAPATSTAPSAAPVQRSMTTPGQAARPNAAGATAGARSGLFGAGLGGSLMRGLLIGGLFGMLMGAGFGGLGGLFGLLVQVLLIALVVSLAVRFFRRRQEQPAGNGPRLDRTMFERSAAQPARGPAYGGGGGGARGPGAPGQDALGIKPADLETFEQRLVALQAAFSTENYDHLRSITTPEVMSYLAEELAQNAAQGVRTEASDVTLLQGDVAESWRENDREFATVAMRYGMRETKRDRNTGAIIDGIENQPVESTETWTFVRERGGDWKLSAIQ